MIILFLILIFICLFLQYVLSRNDFVLLRKNISITQMFDYFFLNLILGFFFSRIFYIMDTKTFIYLYPINFLHIFKLHGMSIYGFFVGMGIGFLLLTIFKKIVPRATDIYMISMIPFYFLMFASRNFGAWVILISLLITLFVISILTLTIKIHNEYKLKDGSLSAILFLVLTIDAFVSYLFASRTPIFGTLNFTQIISFIIFIAVSVMFIFMVTEEGKKTK